MATIQELLAYLEEKMPVRTAESWDNSGFLCGRRESAVSGVLIALDITDEVIDEAAEYGANVILAHHPLIFGPLKNVTGDTLEGRRILKLAANGIAAVCMHTNLDIAHKGVNEQLARALGLQNLRTLSPSYTYRFKKVGVTVPAEYEKRVVEAMFEAGGGDYGAYQNCSFTVEGKGTFTPMAGAEPFTGEIGKAETVKEKRVEMIVREDQLSGLIASLRAAHPYECPAYDIYDTGAPEETLSIGMLGDLPDALSGDQFLERVMDALQPNGLRYCAPKDTVKTVAVGGGACGEFADLAFAKGADVFVTADLKYHALLDGQQKGQFLVDAGHFATENLVTKQLLYWVNEWAPELPAKISEVHRDVTRFYL